MKRALMLIVVVGVAAMLATGCSQKKDETLQPAEAVKAPATIDTAMPPVEPKMPMAPTPAVTPTTVTPAKGAAKTTEKAVPAKSTATKATSTTKVDTSKKQDYTVKSGDTLSSIAKHFYGDETQWKKIADANKDKVKDKDKIVVGSVLVIPAK
jgi:nucleoid-associated protein YgaU